jgi:PAS domain S-box-containing protein
LKELLQESGSKKSEGHGRILYLFVGVQEYEYTGDWQWPLHSDAVFCSDVMLNLPTAFEGTKGIIHPDDKALVEELLTAGGSNKIPLLQFRIITTYGEVKLLTGRNLQAAEVTSLLGAELVKEGWLAEEQKVSKLAQMLVLQKRAGELAERLTGTGTWYYEVENNYLYYSDEMYRIHGLPRQSLNAHLHTFTPFIHPEDRETVADIFTKAMREQLPLHLEYRIVTGSGKEKRLKQATNWEFNERGGLMLYGTVQDITEQLAAEQKTAEYKSDLQLTRRLLQLNEQSAHLGHWYINLVTRKAVFSDSMYRLHGLKPGVLPAGSNVFLNFVHPEDRDVVKEVYKKILQQHTPPDIDYRIIRQDGKVRHLRQRGRLTVYGESEMLMLITLQDVSAEVVTEYKLAELKQQVLVQQAVQQQAAEMADMGSWMWDLETDKITWSESMYNLLGIKTSSIELTQKHLTRFIHLEDRKKFSDELGLAIDEKKDVQFEFRIVRLGETRQICASFRLISYGGKDLFIGTLQDITHHARLRQELALQIKHTASITENMLDRAFITDTENTIRVWNNRCEEVYGLKREAVIGKNIFDVFPQLKTEAGLSLFNRALSGETITLLQTKSTLRPEYHDLHMIPLLDEEDKVSGILHLLHDVTKEQEMQKRLGERLNFIESLVQASPDRILVMDRYMNYLYCNQKAADFYRLRKEDVIGKNVLEVFPASVNDPTYDHFRRALKGETVHIPAIEGLSEEYYFEVFLIPIKDQTGAVSAVLWIHHDLSSDIRMQKQLRKSDEIVNTINAAFIELDSDYRFKYINQTAEVFFRQKKEELLGKRIWEEFAPKIAPAAKEAIMKAGTHRVRTDLEYFSQVFEKWVFLSATPSTDGVIVLFYDRQDIREAHQKLHEEHRRLKEAQVIGKIGSFEWNIGDEIVNWSDEMYRINGMEPQSKAITISDTEALIHPDDLARLQLLKEQAFARPGIYQVEHRIVLGNGLVKHVWQQFESVADESGAIVRVHGAVQDITEQVQSKETIQQMLDGSISAICLLMALRNEEGRIIDFVFRGNNKAAEALNGLTTQEMAGRRLLHLFPGAKELFFAAYVQVVETGEPLDREFQYTDAGRSGWFRCRAVKLGDGLVLNTEDITERGNAERKIREQAHFIEQVTHATPDILCVLDIDTKTVTYTNRPVAHILGYTAKQAACMASPFLELLYEADIAHVTAHIEGMKTAADGEIREVEYRMKEAKGGLRWFNDRDVVFERNAAGVPVTKIGISQDVTGRRQQEDELFKNLNLLQQAEDLGGMGSWEYKIREDAMTWSEGMYQLFDLKPGTRVKKETYLDYVTKEEWPIAEGLLKKLSHGVESFEDTLAINTKKGTRRVLKIKGIAVNDGEGKPVRMLGVDLDITELVKRAEQLKSVNRSLDVRNKELEAKNEELASFSFIASHDLREPLRKIHTFSDWLLQREQENLSEPGQNYLKRMALAVERMDRLIEDVLVLTKLHAATLEKEPVDLNAVLHSVEAELAGPIKLTKTKVIADKLPVIAGNKTQLQHLFKNLISNAVKFQKEGAVPKLVIKNEAVHADEIIALGLNTEKAYFKICFTDNGIGFEKQYHQKIFAIFQRLHARSEYEGTGIGLTICKRVMENHEGTITVESTPGRGSTFCCYFPQ